MQYQHSHHRMPFADPHQANDFPGDPFLRPIPHQHHDYALQNAAAWVSFRHRLSNCSFISVCPSQVPPAPANGQPEGHRDIPPPGRGVARPGRVQDPDHFDMAYQGIVDYHFQPLLDVSNFHPGPSATRIINNVRSIEPCVYIPRCKTRPRCPRAGTTTT